MIKRKFSDIHLFILYIWLDCMGKNKNTNINSNFIVGELDNENQALIYVLMGVIINLLLIIVWLITAVKDENFVSHFSFASTVASIILSVLAIFMSFIGESKTQIIRDKIENETKEIMLITNRFEEYMDGVLGKIDKIIKNTDKIQAAINEHPDEVRIITGQLDCDAMNHNCLENNQK